jgi:hypothetical protein
MAKGIQKSLYKVVDFIQWQKNKQLVLSPEFQRNSIWKAGAKSYLIDTIVRGMPIPLIFLRDKRVDIDQFDPIREVVDGQQRLRTVLSFVCPEYLDDYVESKDAFTIKKVHNPSIAGKAFKELDDDTKRIILDYEFDCHILPSRIDDREIIQIFRRMNSTSYSANSQEIRNSQFFGAFKTSVYDLSAQQLQRWRKWKTFTEDNISRMVDVELTAECMQVIIDGKISGKSNPQIDKLYKQYDETFKIGDEVELRFHKVMDVLNSYFEGDSTDYVLFKRTIFYTFFSFVYYCLYKFKSVNENSESTSIDVEIINKIKIANDRLKNRTAPQNVLEATDRRTTNPKEREDLFNYLKLTVFDA